MIASPGLGLKQTLPFKRCEVLVKKLVAFLKGKKNDQHKSVVLNSILSSYKNTQKLFLNLLLILNSRLNLEDNYSFQSHFSLQPDQIVIAADKNIGFVCMDIDDYLSQYEKINLLQHFGQVNISESCYIEYSESQ